MTAHGDELVFTYEELTMEPESRCLAYSYVETRQTCLYDASADLMSLGRGVHKPKLVFVKGDHMHIRAPLDDFIKAKHDFAADHDQLKEIFYSDLAKSEDLAETKFISELLEFFDQMKRSDDLYCYPALKEFKARVNVTKPVVPVGYNPYERRERTAKRKEPD